MAYRNFTAGGDGSIGHLRSEFDYLATAGARCGIVVGQEYTEEDPPAVTFHGLGRGVFRAAAAEIAAAYGHLAQFGGVSVNDVDAYMAADE
jgi:S-adenosylmethionine hydrolase